MEEDAHTCHFCGTYVFRGHEYNTKTRRWDGERHWLSDCRPDLVEHDPGDLCTWGFDGRRGKYSCYAFQEWFSQKWTDEHKHFHNDGPM